MFKNREEAGEKLAAVLIRYKNNPDAIVVAVPRGGLVPGKIIAKKLNLPLELVLVKKIGHPSNPEYAIGAISLKNQLIEPGLNISKKYIENEIQKIRTILEQRMSLFYGKKKPLSLFKKIIILVDDGIATGNTLIAAIDLIRQEKPGQIILAVPVGPKDSVNEFKQYVDEIICLETPEPFIAIGNFYQEFNQVTDKEAINIFQS